MLKAIHYINQFFGQVGGEDMADYEPEIRTGTVGCTQIFNSLAKDVEVTHTIICGDNFMASRTDEALARILAMLAGVEFDIFIAGPAFNAGRYGAACGEVCKAVKEKYDVPVITSMNEENPGVELFHKDMYIFRGGNRATFMKQDMEKLAAFADRIARGGKLLPAVMEGYFPRGIRHEVFLEDIGREPVMAADRVVDMMIAKLRANPTRPSCPCRPLTVSPCPGGEGPAESAPGPGNLRRHRPRENPDRIQSCSATKWKYDISGLEKGFTAPEYKTIHAGYDPEQADRNPNVVVPLDAIRAYQREGRIGEVDDYYYTTVGTGTTRERPPAWAVRSPRCSMNGTWKPLFSQRPGNLHSLRVNDREGNRAQRHSRGCHVQPHQHREDRRRQQDGSHGLRPLSPGQSPTPPGR